MKTFSRAARCAADHPNNRESMSCLRVKPSDTIKEESTMSASATNARNPRPDSPRRVLSAAIGACLLVSSAAYAQSISAIDTSMIGSLPGTTDSGILLGGATGPVEIQLNPLPTLPCDEQSCTLRISDQLWFVVDYDAVIGTEDRIELRGDVVLATPQQSLLLTDAELVIEPNSIAAPLPYKVYGTARPHLEDMPVLESSPLTQLPLAAIGMVDRATLRALLEADGDRLPLAENPKDPDSDPNDLIEPVYVFFHFQSGLSLDVSLQDWLLPQPANGESPLQADSDPLRFSIPADQSFTLVVDPTEPYLLLAQDNGIRLLAETGQQDLLDTLQTEIIPTAAQSAADVSINDGESVIPDLGRLAVSVDGGIPFEPRNTWGLPEDAGRFKGHLLVDSEIPLFDILEIEGTVVSQLGEHGGRLGVNGALSLDFELFDGLGLAVDLNDASAGIFSNEQDVEIYFSGIQAPDRSFLPDFVPLVPKESTRVAGYIGRQRLSESIIKAEGSYGLNLGNLRSLTGVALQDLTIASGYLELSRSGVTITGHSDASLYPGILPAANATLEASFPFDSAQMSYVQMSGTLEIAGIGLKQAQMRADRLGARIHGRFETPISRIMMNGAIDANGPRLSGTTQVAFTGEELQAPLVAARAAVDTARIPYESFVSELDSAREAAIARLQLELNKAQSALDAALGDVASLQRDINREHQNIARWETEIDAHNSWYAGLSIGNKMLHGPSHAAYVSIRGLWIGAAWTRIGALMTSKAIADGALRVAQSVFDEVQAALDPSAVDTDPLVAFWKERVDEAEQTLRDAQA
ncbi:MAG: hypothetical protein KDK91_15790, partial [Gammaproteobacteria bacterium]|nr:hypothetical protein [Gammaproteobacteria bacterium]